MRKRSQWVFALGLFTIVVGCRSMPGGRAGFAGFPGSPGCNDCYVNGSGPGAGGIRPSSGRVPGKSAPNTEAALKAALFDGINPGHSVRDESIGGANSGGGGGRLKRKRSTNDDPNYASTSQHAQWDEELIRAVRGQGAGADHLADPQLCESLLEPKLKELASIADINHDGSGGRITGLSQAPISGGEVLALNFKGSAAAAADECAQQWKYSPGHSEWTLPEEDLACYGMTRAANGAFICMGLVGRKMNWGAGYAH